MSAYVATADIDAIEVMEVNPQEPLIADRLKIMFINKRQAYGGKSRRVMRSGFGASPINRNHSWSATSAHNETKVDFIKRSFTQDEELLSSKPNHTEECSRRQDEETQGDLKNGGSRSHTILSEALKRSITEKGLPMMLHFHEWKLLYSLSRDGDCFNTMLSQVSDHQRTLLLVETTDGSKMGGFVESPWEESFNFFTKSTRISKKGEFYGCGRAFLFTVTSAFGTEEVIVYNWTQANPFIQLCDANKGRIAMGGGGLHGDFGFCVEDNFSQGSTCKCNTYDNDPLAKEEFFKVANFEVYGFSSIISGPKMDYDATGRAKTSLFTR
mmetsp:Transcript_53192/g.64102  ORF Transcript_53192/g.64102 Transcript_53192/m.64102 type:complete len:326 (-) Transcript_53192:32-1009(-)